MRVVFLPAAQEDILSVVEYLLDQFAYDAAERFPDSVEAAAVFVAQNPLAGAASLHGLRSWAIRDFPKIRLYYFLSSDTELRIVRIIHAARDLSAVLDEDL